MRILYLEERMGRTPEKVTRVFFKRIISQSKTRSRKKSFQQPTGFRQRLERN